MTFRALTPVLAIAALVSSLACGRRTDTAVAAAPAEQPKTAVTLTDAAAKAAGIDTVSARFVDRTEPLRASGVVTFDERRTARLGALVEGVVDDLRVQVGDRVTAGALIGRIHSHVVHDAWAAYFKAQAERQRLDAELTYARTAESRAAQLVADKALSPQELERARADLNAATQALGAARAEVTRTELDLRHYGLTPRRDADPAADQDVPITAPFAGTVVERQASRGTAVTPGTPLLVLSDLTRLWITAAIDESLLGRVVVGGDVIIDTPAYPAETFRGTLVAIGDTVDPETRRVTLRIEVANPDRRLKPEMFVTVVLGTASPHRALVVPTRAVQSMEGESVAFVRTATGTFSRRAVTTGADIEGEVEVLSGLTEGDVVAAAGAFLLKSELLASTGDEGQ